LNSQTENIKKSINFRRRRAFLTGASGKIGLKILEILLDLNFEVFAHCSKNKEKIFDFLKNNPQHANSTYVFEMDFEQDLPEIPEDIDCLINCAAFFEKGNLRNTNHLMKMAQMNSFFPAELTSQLAKTAHCGNVINILDGNIYRFNKNYQNYRISKLLLEEITKQSAVLFAPLVRVNAIALGMLETIETPSNTHAKQKEVLSAEISDNNIALTIELLVSCENLTGQIIYLDNGVHLL